MKKVIKIYFSLFFLIITSGLTVIKAESGYDLWLRYHTISDQDILNNYQSFFKGIIIDTSSRILTSALTEIWHGIKGMLNQDISLTNNINDGILLVITPSNLHLYKNTGIEKDLNSINEEGFIIKNHLLEGYKIIIVASKTDAGILYGTFHILRLLQTQTFRYSDLNIKSSPKIKYRLLNHWDNLDRTVERGYAGFSIWDWHRLPGYKDCRYYDYARANASLGINGAVLTNVNANALLLTPEYIEKVAAIADILRNYSIKVYLTARFSAPVEIGGLNTADPLNDEVKMWWKNKADEIYKSIPDFGGFLVKANSEGQPGPQNYGRNHVDGANMLAEALGDRGIVMWRAFVYDNNVPEDRSKQAYAEFKPFDSQFKKNVLIQVKNGPIDFQPREPFHPLFGAMPNTSLMMEFQITLEYLGQGTHLTYLAPLFKECLYSDTYVKGKGSIVAKVIDGTLENHSVTGIAGVSNIGNDINWTGHIFGQANWYSYGRIAWDHMLTSEEIAEEWIKMTFGNIEQIIQPVKNMMLASREIAVNYMTPLGLHHQMGMGHHYGPGPWVEARRADWSSTYYNRADKTGLGFDRTTSGSNAVEQYSPEIAEKFNNIKSCPKEYLLWFHHVPWNYKINDSRNLWEELCYRYYHAADSVLWLSSEWEKTKYFIDDERFNHVKMMLNIQYQEAIWWRNAMLLYFQQFSKMPLPDEYEKPDKNLEHYKNLKFPYAPGN